MFDKNIIRKDLLTSMRSHKNQSREKQEEQKMNFHIRSKVLNMRGTFMLTRYCVMGK